MSVPSRQPIRQPISQPIRQRIRVMHVIGQLAPGGFERQLSVLLAHTDQKEFEPRVAVWRTGGMFEAEIRRLGIPMDAHDGKGLARLLWLRNLLRTHQTDVVYAWGASPDIYATLASLIGGCRRVVVHDGTQAAGLPWRVRAAHRLLRSRVAAIIANSEKRTRELRQDLGKRATAVRIFVVPNGVAIPDSISSPADAAILRTQLDLPAGPIVGSVGRLDRPKNQGAILDAVARLRQSGIEASVVLVGDGPQRESLQAQARELGLAARTRLVGEQSDVDAYLRGFTVFAFPTLLEGMPNALQEALAHGLPTVASDVGDVSRLLDEGRAGILIAPNDGDALAMALERLLRNPGEAQQLGERGRAHMANHYSIGSFVGAVHAVFRDVVESA